MLNRNKKCPRLTNRDGVLNVLFRDRERKGRIIDYQDSMDTSSSRNTVIYRAASQIQPKKIPHQKIVILGLPFIVRRETLIHIRNYVVYI